MPASKDCRITVKDDGASPATVLRSGAGTVRLSKATEAAAASGHTMTLEEYRRAEGTPTGEAVAFASRYAHGGPALRAEAE